MKNSKSYLSRFFALIKREFMGYNGKSLLKDIIAGFTVGAVALPLALAFGASSVDGANAEFGIMAGLITAIIAGLGTGLIGGGSFQISGPTGAMSVVLVGIVCGPYGIQGMFIACFISGLILVICGLLKLGKLVEFIPKPVICGFTSGIALIIAFGQLGNFFGTGLEGLTTIEKLTNFFTVGIYSIDVTTTILSVAVVAIMVLFPKKWAKVIPSSLIAMIVISVIAFYAKLNVKTIGAIPASIINSQTLSFDNVTLEMVTNLLVPGFTIAVLCMIETLLCGVCASAMKKEPFDSDVELVAQGVGKIIVPFFGGLPSTSAIARTSVAIKSGSQTRLTSLFHSIFLILCVFLLAPVIAFVPYATLSGVLMVTAVKMNDWKAIKHYFVHKHFSAITLFLTTMIVTVLFDLITAIVVGVILSLILLLASLSKVEVYVELKQDLKTVSAKISGPLFFASANDCIKKIKQTNYNYERLICDISAVTYIDASALEVLQEFFSELNKSKVVVFSGAHGKVLKAIATDGFYKNYGAENFFDDFNEAYDTIYQLREELDITQTFNVQAPTVVVLDDEQTHESEFAKPLTTATEKSAEEVTTVILPNTDED